MANGFEVIQRQIGDTSVDMPGGGAFGQLQQQLGGLQNQIGQITEQVSVDKAIIEGAKERSEGRKRNKLAPGANRVTAAFNQAYANMDMNMVYVDGSLQLDEGLQNASAPGVLGQQSYQNYNTYSQEVIQSALESSLPQNRPELAFKLKMKAVNNELALQGALQRKMFEDNSNLAKANLLELNRDFENAIVSGNTEFANDIRRQIKGEINSQSVSGYMNPLQSYLANQAIRDTEIRAVYKRMGEEDAVAGPGVLDQRMYDLAQQRPEGLAPDEYELAMESYTSGARIISGMSAGKRARDEALQKEVKAVEISQGKQRLVSMGKQLANMTRQGEDTEELKAQIQEEINQQSRKGYLDPLQAYLAEQSMHELSIQAENTRLGIEVMAEDDPDALARGLNQLFEDRDKMSPEDFDIAISSYAQAASKTSALVEPQKAVNYSKVIDEIGSRDEKGVRNGKIRTFDDLDSYQNELTTGQYYKARHALRSQILSEIKKNSGAASFWQKAQAGGGYQNLTTKEERAAGWAAGKEAYRDQKRDQLSDPTYELTAADEADLLIQTNTPIEEVTSRLDFALKTANLETEGASAEWALAIGRKVGEEAPNAISKLSPKARAIMNMANEAIANSAQPDVRRILEGARLAADPDSPGLEARVRAMTQLTNAQLKDDFKDIFGGDASLEGPEWGAYMNMLAVYTPISESHEMALKSVKQQLGPTYGVDSNFGEPGKVTYLPSNKTMPYADVSPFYKNQVNMKLEAALQRNFDSDTIDPTDKLEWQGKRVLDKEGITEAHVFNYDLYKEYRSSGATAGAPIETHPKAKWRDMDVQIFTEADEFSRLQDNNLIRRTAYFRSPLTGEKVFIKDPGNVQGSPTMTDGSGYLVIFDEPLNLMLPAEYEKITTQRPDEYFNNVVRSEFRKEKKIPGIVPDFVLESMPLYVFKKQEFENVQGQEIKKRIENIEKKRPKGDTGEKKKKTKVNIFEALGLEGENE